MCKECERGETDTAQGRYLSRHEGHHIGILWWYRYRYTQSGSMSGHFTKSTRYASAGT